MKHSIFAAFLLSACFMLSCGDSSGDPTPPPPPAPTLTPSIETLSVGSDAVSQTVTVTSNTTWSIESNQTWCTFSSAGGNGTGTVTVTIAVNTTTSQRPATITLKTTSGTPQQTKTIAVTQDPLGGLADRITIEGSGTSAKLVITRTPTDAGLFFKFGSVVGIYSGNHANATLPAGANSDTFDSGDVAFNPTTTATYGTWDAVPYTDTETDINTAYHTLANVKAGKGDPCRLVGYTVQQIKDATAVPDNGIWRLPTNAENQAFSGQTGYIDTTVHWWDPAGGTNPSPFSGVAGGEFPSRNSGGAGKFLPASGYRLNSDGSIRNQGTNGHYWSSSPSTASLGYYLYFYGSNVGPGHPNYSSYGFAVRCVRR